MKKVFPLKTSKVQKFRPEILASLCFLTEKNAQL